MEYFINTWYTLVVRYLPGRNTFEIKINKLKIDLCVSIVCLSMKKLTIKQQNTFFFLPNGHRYFGAIISGRILYNEASPNYCISKTRSLNFMPRIYYIWTECMKWHIFFFTCIPYFLIKCNIFYNGYYFRFRTVWSIYWFL